MSAMNGTSGISTPAIQGYEVLQVLGSGGMGIAYLARQEALKRLVCVKVMSISDVEDAELSRARFKREAELLASVSHPNILSVFDFGVTADSGLPFLVTEYIEKGDLRKILTVGEPLPVDQARSLLGQVGEAVEHLHGRGIIHRDLKPENILMCTDSHAKVGDFGIAVMQESVGSAHQVVARSRYNRLCLARTAIRAQGRRASRPVFAGGLELRALDGTSAAGSVSAPLAGQSPAAAGSRSGRAAGITR